MDILDTRLDELDLSSRVLNRTRRLGLTTVRDLRYLRDKRQTGLGCRSYQAMVTTLADLGLTGTQIAELLGVSKQTISNTKQAIGRTKRIVLSPAGLRTARTRCDLTQAELASLIGVTNPDLIRRWEHGDNQPSASMLLRIMLVTRAPLALMIIETES